MIISVGDVYSERYVRAKIELQELTRMQQWRRPFNVVFDSDLVCDQDVVPT